MAKNCDDIAKMMKELGCTGDHITKSGIMERIEDIGYETITICGTKMMFCGIKMKGGFVVIGKGAACIDPENWRDKIGRKISFDNSFEEIWKLEAYRKMAIEKEPTFFNGIPEDKV